MAVKAKKATKKTTKKAAKKATKKETKKVTKKAAPKKATKKVAKATKKTTKKMAEKAPAAKKATKKAATKKAAPAVTKTTKKAAADKGTKKATGTKRKPNEAFMKPLTPSAQLAQIVGDSPLPRTKVVKKLWDYIKKNNLQDPKNKRNILADSKLKEIFEGRDSVSMFEMTKLVSKHLKD